MKGADLIFPLTRGRTTAIAVRRGPAVAGETPPPFRAFPPNEVGRLAWGPGVRGIAAFAAGSHGRQYWRDTP